MEDEKRPADEGAFGHDLFDAPLTTRLEIAHRVAIERRLTPAETDVLVAILLGVPRSFVARYLKKGENTVKTQVARFLDKMSAPSCDVVVWRLLGPEAT